MNYELALHVKPSRHALALLRDMKEHYRTPDWEKLIHEIPRVTVYGMLWLRVEPRYMRILLCLIASIDESDLIYLRIYPDAYSKEGPPRQPANPEGSKGSEKEVRSGDLGQAR